MGVPTSGEFYMFGNSSNNTIAGAINEGTGASTTNSLTTFTELINASNTDKFDPIYAGTITSLDQVNGSIQYRGYPYNSSSSTGLTEITLCYHESSSSSACSCSNSGTYYINTSALQITNTTIIATGSSGRPLAPAGFYAKSGSHSVYWNGTSQGGTLSSNTVSGNAGDNFVGHDCGSTNYIINPPPTYYNYYIAAPRLKSATSGSYFTSPGYLMSFNVTSTGQNIGALGGETLINASTGNGYSGISPADIDNNDGYLYAISLTQNQNTTSNAYDDKFVTINSSGVVIEVGRILSNNGIEIF
tara:strand:+ start:145 stop:1050 length:906 start_codon:yes stop_codon:yes gene_type:complete